jgi:hypothetical protein
MGNCNDRYDPSVECDPETVAGVERAQQLVGPPPSALEAGKAPAETIKEVRLIRDMETPIAMAIVRQRQFALLRDLVEWS